MSYFNKIFKSRKLILKQNNPAAIKFFRDLYICVNLCRKMPEIFSIIQNNQFELSATSRIGAEGERLAAEYLVKNGFRLVLSNFKAPVGRNIRGAIVTGEIDLIAYDEDKLCFIEVKTRSSDEFASPLAAIDLRKQRQIVRTSRVYRKIFHLQKARVRFDAVSIILNPGSRPKIELFKGFFNENSFQKSFWADDY
jgi:putative endonuclease